MLPGCQGCGILCSNVDSYMVVLQQWEKRKETDLMVITNSRKTPGEECIFTRTFLLSISSIIMYQNVIITSIGA